MADSFEKGSPVPEDKMYSDCVFLPQLISNQYGMLLGEAELMVIRGQVYADDVLVKPTAGHSLFKIDDLDGKSIEVKDSPRTVRFRFDRSDLNAY